MTAVTDDLLDVIYDIADDLMQHGKHEHIDAVLRLFAFAKWTDRINLDILIGMLTATLPAKNSLPSRGGFFGRVHLIAITKGEPHTILDGLE